MNAMDTDPQRDWPEDFSHENGNYLCRCFMCGSDFRGHKRRIECHKCAESSKAAWEALTPEQQTEQKNRLAEELRELWKKT
jgi:hypothetical protein